jgi:hypothetical protein
MTSFAECYNIIISSRDKYPFTEVRVVWLSHFDQSERGVYSTWPVISLFQHYSSILSRFSWLSVHALSQAAEACASPVRLGVSKPLGASSVIADYGGGGRGYFNTNHHSNMSGNMHPANRQSHALMRQLHVRAARRNSSTPTRDR